MAGLVVSVAQSPGSLRAIVWRDDSQSPEVSRRKRKKESRTASLLWCHNRKLSRSGEPNKWNNDWSLTAWSDPLDAELRAPTARNRVPLIDDHHPLASSATNCISFQAASDVRGRLLIGLWPSSPGCARPVWNNGAVAVGRQVPEVSRLLGDRAGKRVELGQDGPGIQGVVMTLAAAGRAIPIRCRDRTEVPFNRAGPTATGGTGQGRKAGYQATVRVGGREESMAMAMAMRQ